MKATKPANKRMARYRERLRAAGRRPVQFWVPDTRAPEFVAQLRLQCLTLANDPAEAEVLGFAEQAATHIDSWQ